MLKQTRHLCHLMVFPGFILIVIHVISLKQLDTYIKQITSLIILIFRCKVYFEQKIAKESIERKVILACKIVCIYNIYMYINIYIDIYNVSIV